MPEEETSASSSIGSTPLPAPLKRRQVLIGGLFAGVALTSHALTPRPSVARLKRGVLDSWMPARIGRYDFTASSGVVLPPADELSERLYDNLVTRIYRPPEGPAIMLMLAYSSTQDGMLQVHRPEFCYEANGYSLTPTTGITLSAAPGQSFAGSAFVGTASDRIEQVVYWTRIGPAFPQSWSSQRLAVMRENLHGRIPDGLLGRVSMSDVEGPTAIASMQDFIRELSRAASPRLQRLLFLGD